jgi:hypothetical protein
MKIKNNIAILVSLLGCMVITPYAQAVPQTAKLENSATFATGQTVQAFRVPTFDSTNKSKFYDVVIDLNINTDGSTTSATVTSTPSLIIGTVNVVPGTYQETGGTDKCVVTNIKLINGRTQSLFRCADTATTGGVFEFSVATGAISAGHPFQSQLIAKKVNIRTDVSTQNWGIVTATNNNAFRLGGCVFGSPIGTAVGVKTNGLIATVNAITNDNLGVNTFCAPTINKLP